VFHPKGTIVPEHYILNDGTTLPKLGLGTYSMWGHAGMNGMLAALEEGYRLLDSAVKTMRMKARSVKQSGLRE
jgi:diketogulonate reductase-like aldo/keto reductase